MHNLLLPDQYYVEPDTIWADDNNYDSRFVSVSDIPPYAGKFLPIKCAKPPMRNEPLDYRENYYYYPQWQPQKKPKLLPKLSTLPNYDMEVIMEPPIDNAYISLILIIFFVLILVIGIILSKSISELIVLLKSKLA